MGRTTLKARAEVSLNFLGKAGCYDAYFHLYDDLMTRGGVHIVQIDERNNPGPLANEEIFIIASMLKTNSQLSLKEAEAEAEKQLPVSRSKADIGNAINIAIQAMIMLDSSAKTWHSTDFALGDYKPTSWLPNETFADFVERSFPRDEGEKCQRKHVAMANRTAMKAWKLKKRLGISFRKTNNLAEHLLYDSQHNALYLFHQVAFLKSHLENIAQGLSSDSSFEQSLKVGTLPPKLLLETLCSLHSILFLLNDNKSAAILQQLIDRRGFDRECAQYDGYKIYRELFEEPKYEYWGERLAIIHDLILNKPPRNKFERWVQWQTKESNALIVALLALMITIIIGVIGIILACIQTWIAWQAWKHPASNTV